MNDIKTTNLISTPNIQGNIGSCTVQSNEIKVLDRIFTADYRVIQINSCTGKVVSDQTYTSYFGIYVLIIFVAFVLGIVLAAYTD